MGLAGPVFVVDMTSPAAAGAAGSYRVTLACATAGAHGAVAAASLDVQVLLISCFCNASPQSCLTCSMFTDLHRTRHFMITPVSPQVNPPPSGGACTACLLSTGNVAEATCGKAGRALTDVFRLSCAGWADAELPLQYRFGFSAAAATNAGNGDVAGGAGNGGGTWFAFSREAGMDLVLAAGEFDALAVV